MVFVEFTHIAGDPRKTYMVGSDLEEVLKDTSGGTKFSFWKFQSHQIVSEEKIRSLDFKFFTDGVRAIEEGETKSFWLGTL